MQPPRTHARRPACSPPSPRRLLIIIVPAVIRMPATARPKTIQAIHLRMVSSPSDPGGASPVPGFGISVMAKLDHSMALENSMGFFFLLGRESGCGSYCDVHLFKGGAGFFGKFLGGDVVAVTPGVNPGEMPHVGHSPADDAGEVADLFG
jgi:hypothetical protein